MPKNWMFGNSISTVIMLSYLTEKINQESEKPLVSNHLVECRYKHQYYLINI